MPNKYLVGDVICFKWKGSLNTIIGLYNYIKFHSNKCTHVGIVTRIKGNEIWISEAIETEGEDFKEYLYTENWLEDRKKEGIVFQLRPKAKLTNVKKNAEKYNGSYYDWLSILLMPFKLSFDCTKLVFCSEVVGRILYDSSNKKLNLSAEYGINYEKITPMHIYLSEQFEVIV